MNIYYDEIDYLIRKNEINRKARFFKDNSDTLETYWNIGRLIVEAQGGESRAKYGNGLIKEWSIKLTKLYGKGYHYTNLSRFRSFYLAFPKLATVWQQLTWSNIKVLLSIKDENKRNYYINLCIENNLSTRELISRIKNNSYERLLEKPKNIEIISLERKENYSIKEHIKNPIIIELNGKDIILSESNLQIKILASLKNFFEELGLGYTFVGNEYKIKYGNKNYFIDILLFNYKINSFVVVELKMRELRREDKAQIMFYMSIVDSSLKEEFHNSTKGIIVSKYQDKFIVSFVSDENIIPLTYLLREKEKDKV